MKNINSRFPKSKCKLSYLCKVLVFFAFMGSFRGVLYALISSTTFGLVPFFSIALLGSGMSAATVLFYRMGVAALLIGLVAAAQRKSFVITAREFVIIVGLGWLYAGTSLGLILSYSLIPSGIATTIHFLYPILVTFLMIVFFREKRSAGLVVAAVVSLLGVGLLSWSGGAVVNVEGIMLVLITVITYALYIVGVNKTGVGRIDSLPLTFYILLSAAVLFAMFAGLTTGIGPIRSWYQAVNVLLIALVPTVISNLTLILAVKNVGSTVTAILGSMEPVTAVLVGIFHFGEPFNLQYASGLMLILASVCLVVWSNNRRHRIDR